jgi:hypothetical protein
VLNPGFNVLQRSGAVTSLAQVVDQGPRNERLGYFLPLRVSFKPPTAFWILPLP